MSEELEATTPETAAQDAVEEQEPQTADQSLDGEAEEGIDAPQDVEEVDAAVDDEGDEAPFGATSDDPAAAEVLQAKAAAAFGLSSAAEAEDELEDEEEEEEPEEEEEEEEGLFIPDDGRAWFVVHCYSGYENKVRHSIEQRIETMDMQDKIFDVVVPTEEEIEIKDGKRRTIERRVFPGYILVQMLMSEDSWYVVRNTPGVTGFVGMGNDPTPLRPDEVAKIMSRMEAEAPKVKFDFQIGEKVRIGTGPFADFIGTVAEIDADRAKVRVMVSFFGRETPVELDFLHVEKV